LNDAHQTNIHEEIKSILKSKCLLPFSSESFEFPPAVYHGCETWSLKFREKHRLRVFDNRVLRTSGPKEKGDLQNLYSLPKIRIKSRWMTWVGHVAFMGEKITDTKFC
jgi:hypothetical protein